MIDVLQVLEYFGSVLRQVFEIVLQLGKLRFNVPANEMFIVHCLVSLKCY